MNEPKKPFCLEYTEAENKIFNAIQESVTVNKIPFYLLEGILTNILHQVRENAKTEKENASIIYLKQMQEYKAETEGSGDE